MHRQAGFNLSGIKLLVTDFDGVISDNRVWTDQNGNEMVCCNKSDFLYLKVLKAHGVEVVVLTQEQNASVEMRCKKLGIECYVCEFSPGAKVEKLLWLCERHDVDRRQVCFIGNDLPDVACLRKAGVGIVPKDAFHCARMASHAITHAKGGGGVIREVSIEILRSKGDEPLWSRY